MKRLIAEVIILIIFMAWAADLLFVAKETTNGILVLILTEIWSFRCQEYSNRRERA
jgi:steroid 5-alpha reductase family enzyme